MCAAPPAAVVLEPLGDLGRAAGERRAGDVLIEPGAVGEVATGRHGAAGGARAFCAPRGPPVSGAPPAAPPGSPPPSPGARFPPPAPAAAGDRVCATAPAAAGD